MKFVLVFAVLTGFRIGAQPGPVEVVIFLGDGCGTEHLKLGRLVEQGLPSHLLRLPCALCVGYRRILRRVRYKQHSTSRSAADYRCCQRRNFGFCCFCHINCDWDKDKNRQEGFVDRTMMCSAPSIPDLNGAGGLGVSHSGDRLQNIFEFARAAG